MDIRTQICEVDFQENSNFQPETPPLFQMRLFVPAGASTTLFYCLNLIPHEEFEDLLVLSFYHGLHRPVIRAVEQDILQS